MSMYVIATRNRKIVSYHSENTKSGWTQYLHSAKCFKTYDEAHNYALISGMNLTIIQIKEVR